MSREVRDHLRAIFDAGLAAVDPAELIGRAIRPAPDGFDVIDAVAGDSVSISGTVAVIGAGKAAARMAAALDSATANLVALEGAVIVPVGSAGDGGHRIGVLYGEHPVPGRRGLDATRQVVDVLQSPRADHIVCLISGGASSLLVMPIKPLLLEEKQEMTTLLLLSGAEIGEINAVRKHLSAVKGGRLLETAAPRPVTTLLLSDVIGNDQATIGSGPSVPDETTFAEAIEVLRRYGVWDRCPDRVRQVLLSGRNGDRPETVRRSSPAGRRARSVLLGCNETALAGAGTKATELGYDVQICDEPVSGETTVAARRWLRAILASDRGGSGPKCWLAGGETTVAVRGSGRGGRNQEFALALVEDIAATGIAVLSAGTDGIDGQTDAAGAFVDGSAARRAERAGLDPPRYLENNDSFRFFEELGDLLVCGPTGTNVMDLKIAIRR